MVGSKTERRLYQHPHRNLNPGDCVVYASHSQSDNHMQSSASCRHRMWATSINGSCHNLGAGPVLSLVSFYAVHVSVIVAYLLMLVHEGEGSLLCRVGIFREQSLWLKVNSEANTVTKLFKLAEALWKVLTYLASDGCEIAIAASGAVVIRARSV